MLRKTRKILALVVFLITTLLFLDFTGTIHLWFGWLAKIQLIPAILAANLAVIIALALITLLFGRIYCSVICPLGILQDGISKLSKRTGKRSYSKAVSWLRYSVLVLFIALFIAGISSAVALLDPYSAYGRIATDIFAPLYRWGNNFLAFIAERFDSYAFYSVEVLMKGCITFAVALITLVIVGILAWRHGRTYCNTICPVGTTLGLLSKFSIFRITFDKNKCTNCKLCEKNCKASCIDAKTMNVDNTRCVACFNCIDKCKFEAIKYTAARKTDASNADANTAAKDEPANPSRRNMLALLGTFAAIGTVKAQQLRVDGGLADIEDKKVPDRKTPIVPPGAESAKNMARHCTSCQLCVSSCPNNVLRPSNKLTTFMQPEMSFEKGYCRPECTECSQVCPAAAIKPITTADKSATSIGSAVWIKDNCIVNRDKVQCHSCERHCPTGAITLVAANPDDENSLKTPAIDKERCIGCGACEYHCPARPFSAVYVEGNVTHHKI